MENEYSKVSIKFLLIFGQSGDVLFFLYAHWLRGYTATISEMLSFWVCSANSWENLKFLIAWNFILKTTSCVSHFRTSLSHFDISLSTSLCIEADSERFRDESALFNTEKPIVRIQRIST